MDFGGELTPADIAKIIFDGPPRPAGSVQLGLEDCAPPDAPPKMQAQILSEVLMLMFLEGVKVRYGEDKRPEKLTPAEIEALADYVRSYGFYILVRTNTLDEPPVVSRNERTELKHFHERFYDFDRGLWHEVAFDFAPVVTTDMPQADHTMIHKSL